MRLKRVRIARRKVRRLGLRHKTAVAVIGGVLTVIPAGAIGNGTSHWAGTQPAERTHDTALVGGFDPKLVQVNVDGTIPQPVAVQQPLPPLRLPDGPLGIPGSALRAYHHAADLMAREQPKCHLDWALIASIGRIESNHARGGYVDRNGNTVEPILGPELNGTGTVAAIPDTDGGRWDRDTVWDRAVGPTQFIPATWRFYGADGNGDGVADPNNIYDATLATGRYLCSGGADLANPDQLRAAIYRYNNADWYVETVILWADAYRKGVAPLPDSQVPIGAPLSPAVPAPPPVAAPPPGTTAPPPAPVTTTPPAVAPAPAAPVSSSAPTTTTTTTTTTPGAPAPPTTTTTTPPTCEPSSTPPTTTTVTTTTPAGPDPCAPPTTPTTSDTSVRPTS